MELLSTTIDNEFTDEVIREHLDHRILILNREIDDTIIEDYTLRILQWNAEDLFIPVENRIPIMIYINCPGGDVDIGMNLVDVIEASKTPVRAVCFAMAASMALSIYAACHVRYAFKNSILLMHDGSVAIQNSSSKAKDTMSFIDKIDARQKKCLLSHTKMTEEFYNSKYDTEYYMYADEDGVELGFVDKIIGKDITLEEVLIGK